MGDKCKLFVGNLSYNAENEDLMRAFMKFGSIKEAAVITDRTTGKSRGFGFVTFDNEAHAETAKQTMHETELLGRSLTVRDAETRRSGGGGGGGGGGGRHNDGGYGHGGAYGGNPGYARGDGYGGANYQAAFPGAYGGGAAYGAGPAYGAGAAAYGGAANYGAGYSSAPGYRGGGGGYQDNYGAPHY